MTKKKPCVRYKRILIKLSGEALQGDRQFGISPSFLADVASEFQEIHGLGVEIALVIGGGNIFRGVKASADGMDRAQADYMGMLATIINALALQDALERQNVPTRVLSALAVHQVSEPYIRRRAIRHLEKGRVVVFAAGTGSPYFTTDTAAALRAAEIHAQVIIKATKVSGVFDRDPAIYPDAVKFDKLSHMEVIERRLKVMDTTAASLCMDNSIPIIVLNACEKGNMKRAVLGENVGTVVGEKR